MKDLTDLQREILNFIIDFKADREYSPTLREIGKAFNFTFSCAFDVIAVLEKKGYIFKEPGISRGIKIIKNPEGVVYRVERENRVDFLCKWVRVDKEDGKYMKDEIWNKGIEEHFYIA